MTLRYTTHRLPGGIHPPEQKMLSNTAPLRTAPLTQHVVIPLSQHIGAEAKPVVHVGQNVLRGQCIGEAQSAVSANVHASSSGTVVAIEPRATQHPSGLPSMCVVIETDGLDAWLPEATPNAQRALPWDTDPEALRQYLREAGIVGLGGAGFPTALKARPASNKPSSDAQPSAADKIDSTKNPHTNDLHTLIINAVECEPYITADDITIRYHSAAILTGCEWLCVITGIKHVMIGIEDNKPEAITALEKALTERTNFSGQDITIEIVVVPTKYPSGGEKQVIQLLTGHEVPHGTLPASLGILCQNVGTVYSVYRALSLRTPLTSRITTLTGEAIPESARGNYEIRLGTPVSEWLTAIGIDWQQVDRLIIGGPMMGFTLSSAEIPIVKVSNCLIAATAQELPAPQPESACIRCGLCAEACPASLLPQQLYWYAKSDNVEGMAQQHIMDCIECGACAYVCPSHIPLVQYYRYGKSQLREQQQAAQKSDHSRERFEARRARIERENAEREAKRLARTQKSAPRAQAAKSAAENGAAEINTSKNNTFENNTSENKTSENRTEKTEALPKTVGTPTTSATPTATPTTSETRPASEKPIAPETPSISDFKNNYLKAEKKWKDAQRALEQLQKNQKKSAETAEAQAERLEKYRQKVEALKLTAETLKAQWQAQQAQQAQETP